MFKILATRENTNNNIPFLNLQHFTSDEDSIGVAWDYLKDYDKENFSWTKTMISLQGITISAFDSLTKTIVKIIPINDDKSVLTVNPPEDLIVPEWFRNLF